MQILLGQPALSAFSQRKMLSRLKQIDPQITGCDVSFFYLVFSEQQLSERHSQILNKGLLAEPMSSPRADAIYIVPRQSTVSPWSTKATDIFKQCGVNELERVECGMVMVLRGITHGVVQENRALQRAIHDRMTQSLIFDTEQLVTHFLPASNTTFNTIDISEGLGAFENANQQFGLGLTNDEMEYLLASYRKLNRNPSDVELMMFAQANSEHCRHKIFNADWKNTPQPNPPSLFGMIKHTYARNSTGILSAYHDNAAVIANVSADRLVRDPITYEYRYENLPSHMVIKVETHNHPTAIAPFPGAATGSGGEIRDEGATGRGAQPKAGLVGFSVSNLCIPNYTHDFEQHSAGTPDTIASALQIMLEAPIGAASYNNEFGRPTLCGYFRTLEVAQKSPKGPLWRGYHKPIMIAGGLGTISSANVKKMDLGVGTKIIVLGGEALKVGLGGGAASSVGAGSSDAEHDYASVQRANPEMQRRAQEVIDSCAALEEKNPILSIHDVGAGGLANAIPELMVQAGRGGDIDLRSIPIADSSMSPLAIWCNESQERYVVAIAPESLPLFTKIAERERCPFAVVGEIKIVSHMGVIDTQFGNAPIDLPLDIVLGKTPKLERDYQPVNHYPTPLQNFPEHDLVRYAEKVLTLPAVASKNFLITIGDRSVGGLVARDQMVGPWQVPVADVAVTTLGFNTFAGEAMAIGERAPLALHNAPASGRMAVGEAITNIVAADIDALTEIKLSANWMAAAGHRGEDAKLYDTVRAVALEMCSQLQLTIPVGKDSLSMQCVWRDGDQEKTVIAPLSLIVSSFAPVSDVRRTLTPMLNREVADTELLLLDLGEGKNRLSGSALAQVHNQFGDRVPDVDEPLLLKHFVDFITAAKRDELILAYHDRSDGGLLVTLCEMAFATHCGLEIDLSVFGDDLIAGLFNEELGAVIQIDANHREKIEEHLQHCGLAHIAKFIGRPSLDDQLSFFRDSKLYARVARSTWQQLWSQTSFHMQALRDNPKCAQQEFAAIADEHDAGLPIYVPFDFQSPTAFYSTSSKPRIAVLREQGVNGHREMAAAFDRAGFIAVDVHMSDLIAKRHTLETFHGLVACGGFSYGDVLGAGRGWAQTILQHNRLRDQFSDFFARDNTFSLGVCNGCQMLANLTELFSGAEHWPTFTKNISEQFEARFVSVEIMRSPSLFFNKMEGAVLPIVVSHGEGKTLWRDEASIARAIESQQVCMRYVDHHSSATERYPFNPNGSERGVTALTTLDGRITAMMPHPERVFRSVQWSWHPALWPEDSPWMQMFRNARRWMG